MSKKTTKNENKRGRGRPATGHDKPFALRASAEQIEAWTAKATASEMSLSAWVRTTLDRAAK